MTPLPAHTRLLLRVADEIDQCFLPRSSNLITWVAAARGLPIGLCTFRSCPACDSKFPSRVSRKSLREIFLPPSEEKECSYSEWPGQTDGRRVPLSTSMCEVDRIRICHSISLIYIAQVAFIIRHNLRLYGRSRMELQFHTGPARKLSTNLCDIHHCWVYSE